MAVICSLDSALLERIVQEQKRALRVKARAEVCDFELNEYGV